MKQKLIGALETCGFVNGETIFLQGTMNPNAAYPSSFVTFWTNFTDTGAHYDNEAHAAYWNFSVIYYSDDPTLVNTQPLKIAAALKAAGFVQQGKGQDILSDEKTHTGWAMEFTCPENQ